MAQAGFYHQPSSTGDDRAMCFTCNVCLVCWEPTDEPWSEHERHSPQCPFVKGEYTQNVPMSVTYATEPSHLHGNQGDKVKLCSITCSSSIVYMITMLDCSYNYRKKNCMYIIISHFRLNVFQQQQAKIILLRPLFMETWLCGI